MERLKEKSLKQKRQEKQLPQLLEQNMTELELRDTEKNRALTELELAVLELQNK